MKRVGLFLFVTALSCLLSAYDAAAQVTDVTNLRNITSLSSSGEWAGGKLTRNVSVQLTGDVTLKAPIVIPSGRVLTITKTPKAASVTGNEWFSIFLSKEFAVPSGSVHCMFEVQEGGKLIIEGNDRASDYIAIKGNTGLETPQLTVDKPTAAALEAYLAEIESVYSATRSGYKYYVDSSKPEHFLYDFRGPETGKDADGKAVYKTSGGIIYLVGTLEMRHAKLTCAFSRAEGAAIKRPLITWLSQDTVFGPLTMENCDIRGCMAASGPAIIIYNQKQNSWGGNNNLDNCRAIIKNSLIYRNYSRASGACGAVRTGGGVVGNLEMEKAQIYQNYSKGYGAGLIAAGQGLEQTRTILNGCTIRGNHSLESYGGGALFTGSFEFTGSKTKIYSNSAATYGGGIHVITYNGVSFNMVKELSMKFDNLEIYDNSAKLGGGGMCFFMRDATSLKPGSTINLDIDGAVVRNNTSDDNGAGILLSYNNTSLNINLNINSGEIKDNTAANYGGGIYCQIGNISDDEDEDEDGKVVDVSKCKVKLNGGTISGNTATSQCGGGVAVFDLPIYCDENASGITVSGNKSNNKGGGIYISNSNFTMNSGHVYGNKCLSETGEGGGIFCAAGSVMNITGGMVGGDSQEYANNSYNGAGIFVENSSLVMNRGTVSYNKTVTPGDKAANAGGIYVKGTSDFTFNDGTISNNTSGVHGGGIYVAGCNSFLLDGGVVSDNEAGTNGGGIFLSANSKNVSISGGTIKDNEAAANGGGLVVAANATVSGGEISGNSAARGGGISQSGAVLTINGGSVLNNTASLLGAGVYIYNSGTCNFVSGTISGNKPKDDVSSLSGGGVYVVDGSFTIDGGNIASNKATEGGGLYANNGTITISDGDIESNRANLGGGIRLNGSANLTFTGGNVSNNTADNNGGGFYTGGNSVTTFSNGNVTDNTAANGGGIYMMYYSQMTFSDGIIRDNRAKTDDSGYGTAYRNENVQGAGGGLFLKDNAQFTFDPNSSVGIFNNIADQVGDDLVVGSANAQVVLPDVSNMVLTGYNSKTSELYWVEDYMTGDTGYSNGTAIAGAGHSAVRYRDAIAAQSTVYKVPAGTYKGKYLALSIGHEVIYIILKKSGLQPGECAIFRISRVNGDVSSVYSELLMTGVAGGAEQTKKVALYSGTWKVEELSWTWSYDPIPAIQREITGSSTAEQKTFTFVNAKQSDLPKHAEDIVVNDFGD